jgi:hypothetical protein
MHLHASSVSEILLEDGELRAIERDNANVGGRHTAG